jgi:ABC-type uncharacterized transport system auxiliary subunit
LPTSYISIRHYLGETTGLKRKHILLTTAVAIALSGCGDKTENTQPINLSTTESERMNTLLTQGLQRAITLDIAKTEYKARHS